MGPHYTRVAVVQIAYHPAIVANFRSPLEDPLWDPKRGDSLVPANGQVPDTLQPDLGALRKRIRAAYNAQLLAKIQAILATCRQHAVRLVVFPEYSIPWEILGGVTDAAGDMIVVAGTHTVERSGRNKEKIYERLAAPKVPVVGQSVCPILHQGRLLALAPKLNPAEPERDSMKAGDAWMPVTMPDGFPSPMGVLICLDFLFRESERYREFVAESMTTCRFLVVPSLTPHYTLPEFAGKAWEEARRYKRPVLYSDIARGGGTALYVDEGAPSDLRQFPERAGYLESGDEGVIIADVNLGYERGGPSTRYDSFKQVKPVAEATLVYQTAPASVAYAQWLGDVAPLLERDDDDVLDELVERIEKGRDVLLNAGAVSGAKARDRRLRKLVHAAASDKITHVEQVRQLIGEVILPPNVLPLDMVQYAMAGASADVVFEWLKRREARAAEFGTVEEYLRKVSENGKSLPLTPEVSSALEGIGAAVRGPKEPEALEEAPLPKERVVLPKGVDPAALGELEAGGFKFVFRRDASAFRESQDHEEGTKEKVRAVGGMPKHPMTNWNTDAAERWSLVAIAEGAERIAVVGVTSKGSQEFGALFVLSSQDDGWVLWGRLVPSEDQRFDAIVQSLRNLGLNIVAIEDATMPVYDKYIGPFESRIDGIRSVIEKRRNRYLEEVNGYFEEPFARVDGGPQSPVLTTLDKWLSSAPPTAVLLTGEFGTGKSTVLAVWVAARLSRQAVPIPILVNLAEASSARDALGLLLDASNTVDTPANRAALSLLIRYRYIVPCFDGFDELATRLGATELEGRLSALFEVARGGPGQVLVSCRSNYFATEQHLSNTFQRALQNIGSSAKPQRIDLVPFNSNQVEHLIRNVCGAPDQAEHALQKIANTYNLPDLVKRPLLLGMVVGSLGQLDASSRVSLADLYEAYLARWLEQTHSGDPECFTDEQKIEFGEALAEQLWRSGSPSCTWEELHQSVARKLSPLVKKLELRYEPAFQEIQGGAFFVREGDNRFRFAHKSFFEYFFARAICRTITARPIDVLNTKPITREVATFVGEILRRHGDPKLGNEVRTVQQFLLSGRANALESTAEAAANALRLLHGLAKWSSDAAGWIPKRANLQNVSLIRADLRDAVLVGVDLSNSDLSCADLSGVDLTGARLEKTRFVAAKLFGTTLAKVDARNANFLQAEADKANVEGADFRDASLRQSMWTRCRWEGVRFGGADITLWAAPGATGLPSYVQPLKLSAQSIQPSIPTLPPGEISAAAWSTDKTLIALGYQNGCIWIANVSSSTIAARLQGNWGNIQSVAWSRDGMRLAVSTPGRIDVWRVRTGVLELGMELPELNVSALCWNPDGSSIAGGCGDGTARVWSAQDGRELFSFGKHVGDVTAIDWEPDGRRIATGGKDGKLGIYDTLTGNLVGARRSHIGYVRALRWSPRAAMVASAGADGILRIWDPDTCVEVAQLFGHRQVIDAIAWADEGDRLASAASDGIVGVWSAKHPTALTGGRDNWHGLLQGWQPFIAIQWAPETNRIFTVNRSGGFYSWNALNGGREVNPASFEHSTIPQIAWNPLDESLAYATGDTSIWDTRSGRVIKEVRGYSVANSALASWHNDGCRLLIGSKDVGEVSLVDAATGDILSTFQTWLAELTAVDWLADGNTFVSSMIDGLISIWSLNNKPEDMNPNMVLADGVPQPQPAFIRPIKSLAANPLQTSAVAAHPTQPILAYGGMAGGVFVKRLDNIALDEPQSIYDKPLPIDGEPLPIDGGGPNAIMGLKWSPDGSILAIASILAGVFLWNELTRTKLAHSSMHANAIAWHPGGEILAIAGYDNESSGTLALKRISDFESIVVLSKDSFGATALAWSPDGKRLAEVLDERGVRIWDVEKRVVLALLHKTSSLSWMARTPSGFCVYNDPTGLSVRLAVEDPNSESDAEFYLPLAGLREIVHRQDKVAAALAGDLSGDDLDVELEHAGFGGGTAWDGEERWVPRVLHVVAERNAGQAPDLRSIVESLLEHNNEQRGLFATLVDQERQSRYLFDTSHDHTSKVLSLIATIKPIQAIQKQAAESSFDKYKLPTSKARSLTETIEQIQAIQTSALKVPLENNAQRIKALLEPPLSKEKAQLKALKAVLEPPVSKEMAQIKAVKAAFESPLAIEAQRIQRLLGPDWENIIQDQVEDDDTDIHGNFLPGAAILDSFSLPGREAILSNLIDLVKGHSPAALLGPRRAGKTSILNALTLRLMATEHVVYHVTLEGKNIVTADDLARILNPSMEGDAHSARTLQARLKESPSVLLIDEIANLLSADHTAFAWLRAVGQEKTGVVLVGSSWDWKQIVVHAAAVTPGSSFGNDVTPVNVGPISEADALEFLETTAPEDVPILPDTTGRWILELCGTWPFYLQVMGYAIVQAVRIGNRKALVEKIGVSDLYESRLLADRDVGYFGTRWAELPERARKVLWQIRASDDNQPPRVRDLAPEDRTILRATGMVDTREQWVEDKPFFDWIRRIADESAGGR